MVVFTHEKHEMDPKSGTALISTTTERQRFISKVSQSLDTDSVCIKTRSFFYCKYLSLHLLKECKS